MSQCLVVPRTELEKLPSWQRLEKTNGVLHSVIPFAYMEVEEFLKIVKTNAEFKERFNNGMGVDEDKNPAFQQIIFYGLIARENEFFVYQRGDAGMKEKHLVSKLSVGVGGHIEPFDSNLIDSLYRELDEELSFIMNGDPINLRTRDGNLNMELFKKIVSVEIRGLVKNDSDDVGKVHVGLFCVVNLKFSHINVVIKDKDENVSGSFMSIEKYKELIQNNGVTPETWTELVVKSNLFPFK